MKCVYSLSQHLAGVLVQQAHRGVEAGGEGALAILTEAHAGDGACFTQTQHLHTLLSGTQKIRGDRAFVVSLSRDRLQGTILVTTGPKPTTTDDLLSDPYNNRLASFFPLLTGLPHPTN